MDQSLPQNHATASGDPLVLAELLAISPNLEVSTKSDSEFEALSATFVKNDNPPPLALVRPGNEEEAATVVAHAATHHIPLAVRVGGHDFAGRSNPAQALVLDLRKLNSVDVVDDGKAAVIGGGILAQDLANKLGETGHTTVFGASGSVGYVGWASHGGYGSFAGAFGLGVDQILAARIIDYQGRVFDADEELLYGIRGAGSAFGVIVSMKVKIYKLEKVLAGSLIYAAGGDIDRTLESLLPKYQAMLTAGIPKELGLDVGVCNIPNIGQAVFCAFVWASPDIQTGRLALAKMGDLGAVVMNTVAELSPAECLVESSKMTPPYGVYAPQGLRNAYLSSLDGSARDFLIKRTQDMPADPATLWVEHHLHGAALNPTLPSCFPYRQGNFMLEIIGISMDRNKAEETGAWAAEFDSTARQLKESVPGGYIVLTPLHITPQTCFGDHWSRLQKLKRKYDSQNRFKFSVTRLDGKMD